MFVNYWSILPFRVVRRFQRAPGPARRATCAGVGLAPCAVGLTTQFNAKVLLRHALATMQGVTCITHMVSVSGVGIWKSLVLGLLPTPTGIQMIHFLVYGSRGLVWPGGFGF